MPLPPSAQGAVAAQDVVRALVDPRRAPMVTVKVAMMARARKVIASFEGIVSAPGLRMR